MAFHNMRSASDSTDSDSEASNAHKMFSLFYGWKRHQRSPSANPKRSPSPGLAGFFGGGSGSPSPNTASPTFDALAAHQAACHEQDELTTTSGGAQNPPVPAPDALASHQAACHEQEELTTTSSDAHAQPAKAKSGAEQSANTNKVLSSNGQQGVTSTTSTRTPEMNVGQLANEANTAAQLLVDDEYHSGVAAERCAHKVVDTDDALVPKRMKHTIADPSQPNSSYKRIEQEHCSLHACEPISSEDCA